MQKARLVCGLIAIALLPPGCYSADEGVRAYRDEALRYEVKYPNTWRVLSDRKGLQIVNYPISLTTRGAYPPPGGAWIAISLKPERFATKPLADWINSDLALLQQDGGASTKIVELGVGCTEIHGTPQIGPGVRNDQTTCYLQSGGRDFSVTLPYRVGDPKASEYRRAYEEMIQSLRTW